jgi:hypothetical protein
MSEQSNEHLRPVEESEDSKERTENKPERSARRASVSIGSHVPGPTDADCAKIA